MGGGIGAARDVGQRVGHGAQLAPLPTMTDTLPDIRGGATRATDAMFASGSTNQGASPARGNAVPDYFNDVLASARDAYMSTGARNATGETLPRL
ncbi:hypothetical protein NYA10_30010 [Burkholderia thailandensis]|nr:hypothetical protein [Burkholderia thailandensis]